jgi:hypothetical protein
MAKPCRNSAIGITTAFAMKFFGWVIHRKNTKTYYLTYSSNGTIPAVSEATEIVKEFGKFYDGGGLPGRHHRQN